MSSDEEKRFLTKIVQKDECFIWTGYKDASSGHGIFRKDDGMPKPAHRFSWERVNGSIPKGLQLRNLCGERSCTTTTHWELLTPEVRFWGYVNKNGPVSVPHLGKCWIWEGSKDGCGYGTFGLNRNTERAHRVSWWWRYGAILDGFELDHRCRVRACVNPEHLQAITHHENVLLGEAPPAKQARQTHCKNGHPLTGMNLYITPRGKRQCRECKRERTMRSRAKTNEKRRLHHSMNKTTDNAKRREKRAQRKLKGVE